MALQHFSEKQHTVEYEVFAGNRFEFRTYGIEVAVFGENFNEPPTVKSIRVRLSDEEYQLLLQWQLQHPTAGINACDSDMCDIIGSIEYQVEEKIFGDEEAGTYAIYLSEVRRDAALILDKMESGEQSV